MDCDHGLPPGAIQQQLTLTNRGTWTFDGKGNLSISDDGVLTILPGSSQFLDVSPSHADCSGTYNVLPDNSVDMNYACAVAGGAIVFDKIHAVGRLTSAVMLVAVPNSPDGQLVLGPQYFVSGSTRTLIACTITAENTTIGRVNAAHNAWPVK